MRNLAVLCTAGALAAIACVNVWPATGDPVMWTPDALYYQARLLEIPRRRAATRRIERTFGSPLSAELRARDPHAHRQPGLGRVQRAVLRAPTRRTGCRRRPLPAAGDRSLLYISLAGYVATILALFGLLLLRFGSSSPPAWRRRDDLLAAAPNHSVVSAHGQLGAALEIAALAAAILTLDRGRAG